MNQSSVATPPLQSTQPTPFHDFPKERYIRLRTLMPLLVPLMITVPALSILLVMCFLSLSFLDDWSHASLEDASHRVFDRTRNLLDNATAIAAINAALFSGLRREEDFLDHFNAVTTEEMNRFSYFRLIYLGDERGHHWLKRLERDGSRRVRTIERLSDTAESRQRLSEAKNLLESIAPPMDRIANLIAPVTRTQWFRSDVPGPMVFEMSDPTWVYDPRERPWYQGAKTTAKPFWTNAYVWEERFQNHVDSQIGITVSMRLGADATFAGVTAIDIILKDLSGFLRELRLTPNGRAFIFDSEGRAVALPNYEDVLTKPSSGSAEKPQQRPLALASDEAIAAAWRLHANLGATGGKETPLEALGKIHHFSVDGERHLVHFSRLGYNYGLDWTLGIVAPEKDFNGAAQELLFWSLVSIIPGLVLLALAGHWLAHSLYRPINHVIQDIKNLIRLDLKESRELQTRFQEFGFLSFAFVRMRATLREMIGTISRKGTHLERSSRELIQIAERLSHDAVSAGATSGSVKELTDGVCGHMNAAASLTDVMDDKMRAMVNEMTTMSDTMTAIAASSEEASVNLKDVATATKQATLRINDVGQSIQEADRNIHAAATSIQAIHNTSMMVRRQCTEAIKEAALGRSKTEQGTEAIENMARAVEEIRSVLGVIDEIADRTNMLALNATIEAASAGPAGKGFAVVAYEIKELAQQTFSSTQSIATVIEEIGQRSAQVVKAEGEISRIIDRINQANTGIMTAVEHQGSAIAEIDGSMTVLAGDMAQVTARMNASTESVNDVTRSVDEISLAIAEVAKNVVDISSSVARMAPLIQKTTSGTWDIFISVGETAQSSINIANQMAEVDRTVHDIADLTVHVSRQSRELSEMARELDVMFSRFKT
ncbi:MAG: hypothetical protein HQL76_15695 [Magnetococcales bacterium]|nr:hypothetical protein [Magnetococcales bacterium]